MTPEQETSHFSDRPPINDLMGPHPFVESEFEEGAGRCDKCGGGPDAEIHQKPVDHLARVADALEALDSWAPAVARIANALERIAETLKRI